MRKTRVYIAGPYTLGDVAHNVASAIDAADDLVNYGFAPYVPHLTHFWHMMHPRKWEEWMALDNEWLRACDTVLRLPGKSKGADIECAAAREMGLPVYDNLADLLEELGTEVTITAG